MRADKVFVIVAVRRINEDIKKQLLGLGVGREKYLFLEEWVEMLDKNIGKVYGGKNVY